MEGQQQQQQQPKQQCRICVFGAGAEGAPAIAARSVIHALLEQAGFFVRIAAPSEQIKSQTCQALDSLPNAEVFRCDYSAEELQESMKDCDLVFACTDHFDPAIHGNETVIGKSIVSVAKQIGVKHFVWLAAPNTELESGGKWRVPMFNDKSVVADFIQDQGLNATVLVQSVPYQHFTEPNGTFVPRRESDKLVFTVPLAGDKYFTGYDAQDVGGVVATIFRQVCEGSWQSAGVQFIPLVGDHKQLQEWMADIQNATGIKVQLNSPSIEEFEKFDVPHAFDFAQLCGWIGDHSCLGKTEQEFFGQAKKLAPMKSFAEWAPDGMAAFAVAGEGARMVA